MPNITARITPPSTRSGPTWPEFIEALSTAPKKGAIDKRQDAWNHAVRSTTIAKDCLQLTGSFEWEQFVHVLLASCFNKSLAKEVPAIVWAATASTQEFRTRYSESLDNLWLELVARANEVVTHISKVVNTSAENDVWAQVAPSAQSLGMLCSGDLNEHGYTSGGAMLSAGKRHLFEGAAWRDSEFVRMVDELRQDDSLTTALFLKLGAPAQVLADMRTALNTKGTPTNVNPLLRQVYATLEDASDILITPVPSVAMLSFLLGAKAPEGRYLSKHSYTVGGTQPGNASGLCASAGGHMRVLHAAIPATLIPAEKDVLRTIFYPQALLKKIPKAKAAFLKLNTLAWPNAQRDKYLTPRIGALLEWASSPLVAAIAYVTLNPKALQSQAIAAQLAKSDSPFIALLCGDTGKEVLNRCADALGVQIGRAFGPATLVPEHLRAVKEVCTEFVADLCSEQTTAVTTPAEKKITLKSKMEVAHA